MRDILILIAVAGLILWACGCSAVTSGSAIDEDIAMTRGADGSVDYSRSTKRTQQPAGAGIFQSPQVSGSEAGDIGGIKFSSVGMGSIGSWLIKIAIAGLMIVSGGLHFRRGEVAMGGLLIAGGVVLLFIPTGVLLWGAVLVACGFLAYSAYKHHAAQPPTAGTPTPAPSPLAIVQPVIDEARSLTTLVRGFFQPATPSPAPPAPPAKP